MDMGKIGWGIIAAFGVLIAIVGGVTAIYLSSFVGTISLGAIYETVESGSLPITNGSNATLATLETGFNSAMVDVNSGATFATSLIPIAVILLVFSGLGVAGFAGYKAWKGRKSGGNNY